jgi:hypothetical protein
MSIILDEPCAQESFLEKEFQNRLSNKPYCSNDLDYGLQIRNKQIALSRKYIQANTPWNLSWLCFDIDYPCVLETTFREKTLPAPNLIIINKKNNHSHLLYGIKDQIHLTDNANIKPIRYAQSVSYALREELMADKGYTGLIIKNPSHGIWNTIEIEKDLWTLGGLAEYLTLPNKMPKRESLIGLGRNCTLFELGRKYAYSEVLKQKIIGNKDKFYNIVLNFIEEQNKDFPEPLQYNEYKAIAKSITNWTWKHYGDKTSKQWSMYIKRTHTSEIQAFRGKIGGLANTTEQQAIKGKLGGLSNTAEQQSLKGKKGSIKSAQIRFEDSNEQLKPWVEIGISRRTYYYRQSKELI